MKVDALFFSLFQSFPIIFFELIGQPEADAASYEFASIEIKEPIFRFDGLLRPKSGSPDYPIYFVEIQFQKRPKFYSRLFAEIYLYFNRYEPDNDWRVVVIFKNRNTEIEAPVRYQELMDTRVIRIYLDELGDLAEQHIGAGIVQLLLAVSKKRAATWAKKLLERSKDLTDKDALNQEQVLELVETIILYRFPNLSREELEAMLGLADLKQTKVYQEIREEVREEARLEGKMESVPRLLSFGLTYEQVAQALELKVEQVKRVAIREYLKTSMTADEMAEKLEVELSFIRQNAVSLLLLQEVPAEAIASRLKMSLAAVQMIA